MAQEFSDWLEQLKAKINIADIIGEYVSIEQKGSRKWACCPFHHEKTPSFCINEDRQSYYCFGCHVGGDAINFVMAIENLEFMDAVKLLADKYRMELPEFKDSHKSNSNVKEKKERLYSLMKAVGQYYHSNLMGEQGAKAREYYANRGISLTTIKTFGLGFSLGYSQLVSYCKSLNYTIQEMEEAGIVDNKDGKYSDAMANRVIVPIINGMKQIVAFGGRVTEKDKLPKYKNTKETILFNKSLELFGQHSIKKLKLEEPVNTIIMVEGYMDVIALYQAGIKNAMASMGTALTIDQAKLLKRYCDKVIICYDSDSAGQKATMRGLDILYAADLDVRVMSLVGSKDPDEYVRLFGKDAFLNLSAQAKPLTEYKIVELSKNFDLSQTDDKGNFAVEATKIIKELKNPVQVEAYIMMLEKMTKINKETLYRQLNQTDGQPAIQQKQEVVLGHSAKDKAVRYILYALFGGVEKVYLELNLASFIDDKNQLMLYNICRLADKNSPLSVDDLYAYEKTNPEVKEIIAEGIKISDDMAQSYFDDCVKTVVRKQKRQRVAELSQAIDKEKDEKIKLFLLAQLDQISKY
ncbi:MAG: DNA primase [Clostridia bacterium]